MRAAVRTERVEHTGGQGLRVRDEVKHVWLLRAVFDVVRSRMRGTEGGLGLIFPGHVQPNNAWLALNRQLSTSRGGTHHKFESCAVQVISVVIIMYQNVVEVIFELPIDVARSELHLHMHDDHTVFHRWGESLSHRVASRRVVHTHLGYSPTKVHPVEVAPEEAVSGQGVEVLAHLTVAWEVSMCICTRQRADARVRVLCCTAGMRTRCKVIREGRSMKAKMLTRRSSGRA
jgi:hypothetical protein